MKLPRLLALQLFTYRAPQYDVLAHDGKKRHSGQALLLAVLLMLFAALLGATFVTVVAFNLSQTARNESKKSAEAAAQAGVRMANDRLVNSSEGEKWLPESISMPPAPTDPSYNTYYTPFEKAQGWAQRGLVKFPDPRLITPGGKDTPTFLMKVEPIEDVGDPNYGLLRVEVIGRSDDNDAAFYRQVVYKGTSVGGGPLSYPMYVANYDTQKKSLRATTTSAVVALTGSNSIETATFTVRDASLFFRGQTVILSQSDAPAARRHGGVISAVDSANNTVTVRFFPTTTAFTYPANSQLRAAGTLMHNLLEQTPAGTTSAAALDGDGDRGLVQTYLTTLFDPQPSTNGLYFGAGLLLDGKGRVDLNGEDEVTVSGPVVKARAAAGVKLNSPTADFPESSTHRTSANPDAVKVRDIPNSDDGVPVLAPPSLAGSDGKYTRYLSLTRDADRTSGSAYGYGPGVYLDNSDDVEKVRVERDLDTTPGAETITYRVLDNWEMQRLWQRKSFPERANEQGNIENDGISPVGGYLQAVDDTEADAHRLAWARPGRDSYSFPATGSLEQRAIRGWVSPWEFVPRGALIELDAANSLITITRDSYADGNSTISAAPEKAWRDPSGGIFRGRYVMTINTSTNARSVNGTPVSTGGTFNGVIFAEGNVRVRGTVGNQDITIVTKGNLYIEGNVRRTGTGRIALLAKRNVVVNPTQVLARPADVHDGNVQDLNSTIAAGASTNTVTVTTAGIARVGDRIRIGGGAWRTVTDIQYVANQDQITFDGLPYVNPSPTASQNVTLTLLKENAPISGGATPGTANTSVRAIDDRDKLFIRDVKAVGATGNYFLTASHVGGRLSAGNFVRRSTIKTARFGDHDSDTGTPDRWYVEPSPPVVTASGTLNIKDPTSTTPENIEDTESRLVSTESPGGTPEFNVDLFHLPGFPTQPVAGEPFVYTAAYPPTGTRGDDTEQTIGKLYQFLFDPTNAATDPGLHPSLTVAPPLWYLDNTQLTNVSSVPARRLARDLFTAAPGESRPALLTTSIGMYLNPDLNATNISPAWVIGSAPQYNNLRAERTDSVVASFYSTATPLQWQTAGAVQPTAVADGDDRVVIARERSHTLGALANYYLGALRLERAQGGALWSSTTTAPVANSNFDLQIEATILAEEGSWFVIPAPMNGSEAGLTTVSDSTRHRRLNYRIHVVGTIAQNFTPTAVEDYDDEVAPDAEVSATPNVYIPRGAMAHWIDASARPERIAGGVGDNWVSVTYESDPLQAGEGGGLKLPVSPEWTYLG